jgi:ERCC4-type nuclease
MCDIIIDSRENKLIDLIDIDFIKKQLDIGDIQFIKNNNIVIIIERKTIDDLLSSIKSERYREQKFRLNNSDIPNNRIFYIIEGSLKNKPKDLIFSAMLNTILRDNMNVIRTKNLNETLIFIKNIKLKIDKYYNIDNNDLIFETIDYISTKKTKKKEFMDKESCFILQLAQIPTISIKIATILAKKYKSIDNFCNILKTNKDELYNIKNLGKNRINNILHFLL